MADPTNDEILASVAPEDAPAGEAAAPSAAPTWDRAAWEFEANGKKFSPETREQAMTWMSQGRNYSQRAFEHNNAVKAWERQKSEAEAKYKGYDKYSEIDNYARSNPDWWSHVTQSWQTRGQPSAQGQPQQPDLSSVLNPIQSELQEIRSWRQQQLDTERQRDVERADQALSTEIEEIRGQHANIPFDTPDESGKTLEQRVIDHAIKINTSSFRAAFRDYYHDKLVESAKAQNLSAQAKAPAIAAKKGILGVSSVPTKGDDKPVNTKGRTYDELNRLAQQEFASA